MHGNLDTQQKLHNIDYATLSACYTRTSTLASMACAAAKADGHRKERIMLEKFGFLIDSPGSLIGTLERGWMKPSAIAVNTDRGDITGEAAFSEALLSRRLSGTGLDVFDMEPPLVDSPPLRGERRVLNPRSAALTEEAATRVGRRGDQHHGLPVGQARSTALINTSRSDYR
ncbi:NAD(P)-dependent oxidoreductase [Caballeronia udeis]|nr:NAD(P)-dependent oxidoreductase [Caballeronia udeis]